MHQLDSQHVCDWFGPADTSLHTCLASSTPSASRTKDVLNLTPQPPMQLQAFLLLASPTASAM